MEITKESFAQAYPELHAEIKKEAYEEGFKAGAEKTAEDMPKKEDINKAKKEAAESERARIKDVKAQSMPGHEALIESLMFDGVTTGEQAAVKIVAAEKGIAEARHKAFLEDGTKIKAPAMDSDNSVKTMKRKEFNALSVEAQRDLIRRGGKVID